MNGEMKKKSTLKSSDKNRLYSFLNDSYTIKSDSKAIIQFRFRKNVGKLLGYSNIDLSIKYTPY